MASIFGAIREEMPAYETVKKTPEFEIRRYGPMVVAETTFEGPRGSGKASGDAFWALAGYIGVLSAPKNVKAGMAVAAEGEGEKIPMTAPVITGEAAEGEGEKIAMTAPVVTQDGEGDTQGSSNLKVMQFVLPSKYTIDTVPRPTDTRVTVREVPGRMVGALVYSGVWGEGQVREKALKLKVALEAAGHHTVGNYSTAFYNSPFTIPYFRRNEVWYELSN